MGKRRLQKVLQDRPIIACIRCNCRNGLARESETEPRFFSRCMCDDCLARLSQQLPERLERPHSLLTEESLLKIGICLPYMKAGISRQDYLAWFRAVAKKYPSKPKAPVTPTPMLLPAKFTRVE